MFSYLLGMRYSHLILLNISLQVVVWFIFHSNYILVIRNETLNRSHNRNDYKVSTHNFIQIQFLYVIWYSMENKFRITVNGVCVKICFAANNTPQGIFCFSTAIKFTSTLLQFEFWLLLDTTDTCILLLFLFHFLLKFSLNWLNESHNFHNKKTCFQVLTNIC